MTEPSQAERLAFVKFARCTALAADRLCGSLLELTKRLENAQIIDSNRPSKKDRDNKMSKNQKNLQYVEEDVNNLMNQIAEKTPDAEKIVESLFRDVKPKKAKKTSENKKAEDVKDE